MGSWADDREELITRVMTIAEGFHLHQLELPWPRTFSAEDGALEVIARPVPDMYMYPSALPPTIRVQLGVDNLVVLSIAYPMKKVTWRHGDLGPIALACLRKHMVLEDLSRI
jgi:hypothetical protein